VQLNELQPSPGASRERIRIGRGHGSGKVKTGGKGTKGQKARTGGGVPPYFEGGQLPLIRKLPYRRGFRNPFRVEFREVNVRDLGEFPDGSTVGPKEFETAGVLRGKKGPVKVLGEGELTIRLRVRADKFTAGARAKIEAAGGTAELIDRADAEVETEVETEVEAEVEAEAVEDATAAVEIAEAEEAAEELEEHEEEEEEDTATG
jgi:large subunit ribosomal protein L15